MRLLGHGTNQFSFTFVRNPWDRIYSCFEQKVRSKGGNCSDYLNHFPRNMSFREWVKTITLQRNILKDRQFAPMHTLMINKSFDSMDFIGHIENFNNDSDSIEDVMREFQNNKSYTLSKSIISVLQEIYSSASVSDERTLTTIKLFNDKYKYLLDQGKKSKPFPEEYRKENFY